LLPFFIASSAKGTSLLIGDAGIALPFSEIDGIIFTIFLNNANKINQITNPPL